MPPAASSALAAPRLGFRRVDERDKLGHRRRRRISVGLPHGEVSSLDRDSANQPPVAVCDGDKGTGNVITEVGVVKHVGPVADRRRHGEREDRAEHLGEPLVAVLAPRRAGCASRG